MNLQGFRFQVLLFIMLPLWCRAQENPYWREPTRIEADSLNHVLASTNNDTSRMHANRQLGLYYQEINRPAAITYYKEQLKLAKNLKQKIWEAEALSRIAYSSSLIQNYSGALKSLLTARSIASDSRSEKGMWNPGAFSKDENPYRGRMTLLASINQHLGILYYFTGDFTMAMKYYNEVKNINDIIHDNALLSLVTLSIGEAYRGMNQPDSSKSAFDQALRYCLQSGHQKYKGLIFYDIGKYFEEKKDYQEAKKNYSLCVQASIEHEAPDFEGMGYLALADITKLTGDIDSSFVFSKNAIATYRTMNDTLGLISAYSALSNAFDARRQTDSAYSYLSKSIALKSALNKDERVKKFQVIGFDEQLKLQALEAGQLQLQNKIRTYSLLAGIGILVLISGIFYRNYRRQRKNKATIEKAYADLKSTQSQLIQSEKMASLGELTAGIAHEIQNPLNFVNNFSDTSKELLAEMKTELDNGNIADAKTIADDVIQNLEKILHHGNRADGIVKGMLQHSRKSNGQKEPTDLNLLTDEYLRLAYHGLRAKDKSFNVTLKTDYDKSIGIVNVIPQDISRVILNIVTNAFHACSERMRTAVTEKKNQTSTEFQPVVLVATKRSGDKVLISISDNGNGIPQKVLDKIFQPFFTTKPTGQGTGLGLSLSYDIIKAHGGEIKVETNEGKGSTFTISIPISNQ